MSVPLLELHNVTFAYGDAEPVLRNLSFAIGPGEVVALVGRNGAGKSTLLRLLNGLMRPALGHVLIQGVDSADLKVSTISHSVGTVFQAPEQQIFNATVQAELDFGPKQLDLTDAERAARVTEAINKAALQDVLGMHPLDLDQAMRRFVAIGSVLATRPKVLLLDEAQRGLDKLRRARLVDIIAAEREVGHAVILVCHDMEFAAATAIRVLGLAGGHLAVDAPVRHFFADADMIRAVSVEQPQIVALTQALGLPLALTPQDLTDALTGTGRKERTAS